jgi:surface carbohydrate biosynthesis protein
MIHNSFTFSKPKKRKILFYDNINSSLIKKKFHSNDYEILHTRKERLNIIVLIKMLFNFKNYIYNYIKFVNPKVVLTCVDNDYNFYTLKEKFPNITFIAIQGGYRTQHRDFFVKLNELKKKNLLPKLKADYIFLYGKTISNEYLKYIKFKPILLGSFRNNFVPISKNKEMKKTVLFISQFRKGEHLKNKFFNKEAQLLPIIENFCNKKNLKLFIAGCSQTAQQEEKNYFLKIIPSKSWVFLNRKSLLSNFRIIDKYEIIIFIDSTLGYEALARNKKVAVFSSRKISRLNPTEVFSWSQGIKKKGFFYSNLVSKKEVFRVLNNVSFITKGKWNQKFVNNFREIMSFNYNNKKLFSIIGKYT